MCTLASTLAITTPRSTNATSTTAYQPMNRLLEPAAIVIIHSKQPLAIDRTNEREVRAIEGEERNEVCVWGS